MKAVERATQTWPVLCFAAANRKTVTNDALSKLIAVLRPGLGQLLEPIQSFCLLKGLPPLTSSVVSGELGLPGVGFIAASDIPGAHARVFSHDWATVECPSPEDFEHAVSTVPSNGVRPDKTLLPRCSRSLSRLVLPVRN